MENLTANKYLDALYLKSKNNLRNGYNYNLLGQLIGIDKTTTQNIMHYLVGKNYIDSTSGYGENLIITTAGIDYVENKRVGKTYKTIRFNSAQFIPPASRSAYGFLYRYSITNEDGTIENKSITVTASDILTMQWQLPFYDMPKAAEKILLQYAKNRVAEKLKEGTLNDHEEVDLYVAGLPQTNPWNPENLIDTSQAEYEVETGSKILALEIKENKLAASIIELRDRINAVFKRKHGEHLLLLTHERNLLDFFKSASSEEEFAFRLLSLSEISRNLNVPILRKITGEQNTQIKSVSLLDTYLKSIDHESKITIDTLRQFGKVRQGYPTHQDIPDVIKGYEYFGLPYPVLDFEQAWVTLLTNYLTSLQNLFNIFSTALN